MTVLRRALLAATGVFRPIVLEKLSGNNFREVSDLQVASDRSLATVLASLGWQDFYLKVNVPEFFNTIGQERTLNKIGFVDVDTAND